MKRHGRDLWVVNKERQLLLDVRCITRGLSVLERVPEYTYRLKQKGWTLVIFSIGRFYFSDKVLRLCTYDTFMSLSKEELRNYIRYHGVEAGNVICNSEELAAFVQGKVFEGWVRFFNDTEV